MPTMREELGLADLSEDQLVELARAVAEEISARHSTDLVAAAMQATMAAKAEADRVIAAAEATRRTTEAAADKARKDAKAAMADRLDRIAAAERGVKIDADVRAREAEKAAARAATFSKAHIEGFDDWSLAKRAAIMISETLNSDWSFCAWKGAAKRRVYLEGYTVGGMYGQKRLPAKIVYHVDGDQRYPPGYIEYQGDFRDIDLDNVEPIVRYIATCWDERPEVPVTRALAARVTPAPTPEIYAEKVL